MEITKLELETALDTLVSEKFCLELELVPELAQLVLELNSEFSKLEWNRTTIADIIQKINGMVLEMENHFSGSVLTEWNELLDYARHCLAKMNSVADIYY